MRVIDEPSGVCVLAQLLANELVLSEVFVESSSSGGLRRGLWSLRRVYFCLAVLYAPV